MDYVQNNVAVAEMLGAKQEQWYPENKLEGTSGVYLVFPTTLYKDAEGNKHMWYPDNVKYHSETLLKFHTDANWQHEALEFVANLGFTYTVTNLSCSLHSKDGLYSAAVVDKTTKLAVFNSLYVLSQLLKLKNLN